MLASANSLVGWSAAAAAAATKRKSCTTDSTSARDQDACANCWPANVACARVGVINHLYLLRAHMLISHTHARDLKTPTSSEAPARNEINSRARPAGREQVACELYAVACVCVHKHSSSYCVYVVSQSKLANNERASERNSNNK